MSIIAAILLLQTGYLLVEAPRAEHASQVRLLHLDARQVARRLQSGRTSVEEELAQLRRDGWLNDPAPLRQFLGLDGTVLEASDVAGKAPLLSVAQSRRSTGGGESRMISWGAHRVPAFIVRVPTSPPIVLVDLAPSDMAAPLFHRILFRQMVLFPVAMILGGALAWLAISRQLWRLRSIVELAARSAAGESSDVQTSIQKDELSTISDSLTEIVTALRHALEYQQRFASQAAHELRTPLTVIRAEADIALASGSVHEFTGALSSIREETEKLSGLVTNLLELGSAGESTATLELVEAGALVNSATRPLAGLAAEQDIDICLVADEGALRVSRVAVEHAIQNLVENAIRHAPPDSTVSVECRGGPGGWRIVVEDKGVGVDLSDADRVFEPFVRERVGGYGLGLAFVKLIAEAHGGTATVACQDVGRTRFVMTLPAQDQPVTL